MGLKVGNGEGIGEGGLVGSSVGVGEGIPVGTADGPPLGALEGEPLGAPDAVTVGAGLMVAWAISLKQKSHVTGHPSLTVPWVLDGNPNSIS